MKILNGALVAECGPNCSCKGTGDEIAHPAHYNQGSIEAIDFIEAQRMTYNIGCAVKYLTRYRYKGDAQTDLRKALWYIEREIAELERRQAPRAEFLPIGESMPKVIWQANLPEHPTWDTNASDVDVRLRAAEIE